jgi:hypothetical protein
LTVAFKGIHFAASSVAAGDAVLRRGKEGAVATTTGISGLNGGRAAVVNLSPVLEALGLLQPLEEQAAAQASASRTAKELPSDVSVLESLAEGIVNQIPSSPFGPQGNEGDGIRKREHEKDIEERVKEEAAVVEGEAHVRLCEREQAAAGRGLVEPVILFVWKLLFAYALALSFAPTIRDNLFLDIVDRPLGWFLAIACGLIPAAVIVWPTLSTHAALGRTNWFGMGAAIGFGIANLIVRESGPNPNHWLAVGLTAWEIALVVFLEWFAQRYRLQYAEWMDQEKSKASTDARRKAADSQLDNARRKLLTREAKISAHIAYVDARTVLHERPTEIVNAAKAAVRHVYRKKVNENLGLEIGADWRDR